MRRLTLILSGFLFVAVVSATRDDHNVQAQPKEILLRMLAANDKLITARYTLKKEERIQGKSIKSEMIVKIQTKPFLLYLYMITPDPGTEILWKGMAAQKNALVHPNSFPYVNLNLDPYGSLMRKNQHHTIFESGFSYLASILRNNVNADPDLFYQTLKSNPDVQWNGKTCYQITIDNTRFAYSNYVVKPGENATSLAKKYSLSEYLLLEQNPNLGTYDESHPGMTIRLPNSYARKIILYIDKITMLPLVQMIYDDKGLLEKYAMESFILNPKFASNEFNEDFPGYGF